MAILRPLLAATGAPRVGRMVIGTVKGDIHDIGKNLVCMMMEGAGFEVFDIGINNGVEKYLEAIDKHQPEILGMSALLTTTMPYMKVVIDRLKEKKGVRNDYIVLVGGAPLNELFAQAVGADAYRRDAAVAVETAKADGAPAGLGAGAVLGHRRGPRWERMWQATHGERRDRPRGSPSRPRWRAGASGDRLRRAGARDRGAPKRGPLAHIDVTCLPASLHNRPERIAEAVRRKIAESRAAYETIVCLYGDCGTGGALDRVLREEGVARIEGAHCYEFFASATDFAQMMEEEPGTFFLHRLPGPPFRPFGDRRARARPLPAIARRLFRPLPPPRPSRASRGRRDDRQSESGGPAPRAGVRTPLHRAWRRRGVPGARQPGERASDASPDMTAARSGA